MPINPKKYSCYGLKKIYTRNLITKKNSCGSKIPLPHPEGGRVIGKIKQNELDCRDAAPLSYVVIFLIYNPRITLRTGTLHCQTSAIYGKLL